MIKRIGICLAVAVAFAVGFSPQAGAAQEGLGSCSSIDHVVPTGGGSFVAAGSCAGEPSVFRVTAEGDLDPGFGKGGVLALPPGEGGALGLFPRAAAGFLVVTGRSLIGLDAQGELDPSFGGDGIVPAGSPTDGLGPSVRQVAQMPDGDIVWVASRSYNEAVVGRIGPDGQFDGGFGGDGRVDVSISTESVFIAADPDGKVVLAGAAHFSPNSGVVRLAADGSPDETFGPEGDGRAPIVNAILLSLLTVAPDRSIRVYGELNPGIYEYYGFRQVLGPDGIAPGEGDVTEFGFEHTGHAFAELPEGRVAMSVLGGRAEDSAFEVKLSDREATERIEFVPGAGVVTDLHDLGDGTFLAVGSVSAEICPFGSCPQFQLAVARLDAATGSPVQEFGSGGKVLAPRNECAWGTAGTVDGIWSRCRVNKPRIRGTAKLTRKKGKAGMVIDVGLPNPPEMIWGTRQTVSVTIPKSVKLTRRGLKGTVRASVSSDADGVTTRRVSGRKVTVSFEPQFEQWAEQYDLDPRPVDPVATFRVSIGKAALGWAGVARLRRGIKLPVGATFAPATASTYVGPFDKWFGPNSNGGKVVLRKAKRKGGA